MGGQNKPGRRNQKEGRSEKAGSTTARRGIYRGGRSKGGVDEGGRPTMFILPSDWPRESSPLRATKENRPGKLTARAIAISRRKERRKKQLSPMD